MDGGYEVALTPTRGLGGWHAVRVIVALSVFALNLWFFLVFGRELVSFARGVRADLGGAPGAWPPFVAAAGLYAVSSLAAIAVPWTRSRSRSMTWTLVALLFWAAGVAVLVRLG